MVLKMNTKRIIALMEQYKRTARINGDTRSEGQIKFILDLIANGFEIKEAIDFAMNDMSFTNTTCRCINHISTYLD